VRRPGSDECVLSTGRETIIVAGNETSEEHSRITRRRPAQHDAQPRPEIGEGTLRTW
jgi:hypothetical protein